ncbi:MAG: hypothetical protein U0792_02515 [Gemmataceae bacterium]
MSFIEAHVGQPMESLVEWVLAAVMIATASVVTLWMVGAIFLDLFGGTRIGRTLALAWVVSVLTMFVLWHPLWQPFVALSSVAVVFVAWWLTLKPRHDREWDPSVAVLPRATRDHDAITIENVRNFEYRSLMDFTSRYQTRTYHLTHLMGADIIFFNWGSPWMSHPVLVFDFGPDGRVCISIEDPRERDGLGRRSEGRPGSRAH